MDKTNSIVLAGRADLIPETQNMASLAKYLHESGMFPSAGKVAGIITIMEYGRELGIPPVAALLTMAIIRGKPTMEAKAMLAVAKKNADITWKVEELNDKVCTMTFMRDGFAPIKVSFTEDEAKKAGLLDKDSWKLYRQDMLFARCASRGARRIAPDAILGLYSTEEMRDVEAVEASKQDLENGTKAVAEGPPPDDTPPPTEFPEEEEEKPEEEWQEPPPPDKDREQESIFNTYLAEIKVALTKAEIDYIDFKKFLIEQGKKMNRKFVGMKGKSPSFHAGNEADVKYLVEVIDKAISLYKKAK